MKTKHTLNFLITGAHDFMAPYLYKEIVDNHSEPTDVWMLGTGELAGVKVDLSVESPKLPVAMDCVVHADGTDSGSFNAMTALDQARNLARALQTAPPRAMVYISSAIVYGIDSGENITEDYDAVPSFTDARAKRDVEGFLTRWCTENGVSLAILRPALVVGTGMGGELRRLVNRIYRGTYRHVAGNEARVSVVHAVDLARAARLAMGHDGVWNVTDGVDPTKHDLVEALAWRLKHKRVYTLSESKARLLARIGDYIPVTGFTRESLKVELSTLTLDGRRLNESLGLVPVSVTEYLLTHQYDDSSL